MGYARAEHRGTGHVTTATTRGRKRGELRGTYAKRTHVSREEKRPRTRSAIDRTEAGLATTTPVSRTIKRTWTLTHATVREPENAHAASLAHIGAHLVRVHRGIERARVRAGAR
eukprot:CAMPEP_0183353818 /NCGR_PEP_ID=MMETSP0164_2-20130417/35217_1 /TAXON_ID=221442 /ORGANISM="Coccolithus pelagicus ssp braarudi, Strain PLY182g" /LENGTH=113 /DNA_ID=CAMNT_0025526577 /DNA_START=154 /DNA_END=491 /DNA_ORIENTATION=-